MIKKIPCIFLCFVCIFTMSACFDEQPGNPTASEAAASKWSDAINVEHNLEISSDDAYKFNNDLAALLDTQAVAVSPQDIQTIKKALEYMGQFNLFVHEESIYIRQVNELYTALYNVYTGNANIESAYLAADKYTADYSALSDACKEKMIELDNTKLKLFVENLYRYGYTFMKD